MRSPEPGRAVHAGPANGVHPLVHGRVFLQCKAGEIKASELTITASDSKPFDILEVQKSDPMFAVTIKADPASPLTTFSGE